MNPIFKTIVFLLIYILLTVLCVFLIGDNPRGSEMPLVIITYSFYLAPFACAITFAINLFLNQVWLRKHIIGAVIFSIFLIARASYILVYFYSLFK
jgi:hypothetical protein